MEKGRKPPRDIALRREAYGEYAKAAVCFELGGEMLPQAVRRAERALDLYGGIAMQNEEDRRAVEELKKLMSRGREE